MGNGKGQKLLGSLSKHLIQEEVIKKQKTHTICDLKEEGVVFWELARPEFISTVKSELTNNDQLTTKAIIVEAKFQFFMI